MRWIARSVLLGILLLAFPTAAGAQGGALKQKAQELLVEGNELATEGDFVTALQKYRAAHELYPSPKLLLNIGTMLRQLGRNAEAAATYEQYLAHPEAQPQMAGRLRKILREIDALVGKLTLVVADPAIRVTLDGRTLRDLGGKKTLRLDPGEHTVVAEREGRPAHVQRLRVEAKGEVTLEVTVPDAATPELEPGEVQRTLGYSAVGVGGVALVVGAILGAVSLSTKSSAEEHCAERGLYQGLCSQEYGDLADRARTESAVSAGFFVTGLAVAAIGFTVVGSADESVEVKATGAGLTLRARF